MLRVVVMMIQDIYWTYTMCKALCQVHYMQMVSQTILHPRKGRLLFFKTPNRCSHWGLEDLTDKSKDIPVSGRVGIRTWVLWFRLWNGWVCEALMGRCVRWLHGKRLSHSLKMGAGQMTLLSQVTLTPAGLQLLLGFSQQRATPCRLGQIKMSSCCFKVVRQSLLTSLSET